MNNPMNPVAAQEAQNTAAVNTTVDQKEEIVMKNFEEIMNQAQIAVAHAIVDEVRTDNTARSAAKALTKGKALGFNLWTFGPQAIFAPYWEKITTLSSYTPGELKNVEILMEARKHYQELVDMLDADVKKPFTVYKRDGRSTRLNRSLASDIFSIQYGEVKPTSTWIIADHRIQELFSFNWRIAGTNAGDAERAINTLHQSLYKRLGDQGVVVMSSNGSIHYGGFAASASHQKKERLVMAEANAMRLHEKAVWFGKTMREFLETAKCTGADIWKARANLVRPIIEPLRTADGTELTLNDLLIVADVEKTYYLSNARVFGGKKLYEDRTEDVKAILGDGAILSLCPIEMQGQITGAGIKGFGLDGGSAIKTACVKHGMGLDDFMNTVVTDINGKSCRIGDYKLIAGEGVFKFDKFGYENVDTYISRINEMANVYPGINKLYLLRQADEVEGEKKARHLTRTLIQQWMDIDLHSMLKITKQARQFLNSQKTLRGAARTMSELSKDEDARSDLGRIFEKAPWLISSPVIQQHLESTWVKRQAEAAGGHLRCNGSYPYIMQDPVALLEVWVLGMNPDDPALGVLRGDEISVDGVAANKELLCVRFPANYQTAKVMVNRPCLKAFESCGNVEIISIHSDILIRQDGDVDGDEMAVIEDKTAIALTKQMEEKYHPPVVVFAHGSKAEKITFQTRDRYIQEAYVALWRAKKFDSVGKYANLAMKCSYLAGIAEKNGEDKLRDTYLLWMSAASTGAIMAIDQVKGNQVDPKLVAWLDSTINKKVMTAMNKLMPFVQQYAKAGTLASSCLPEDDRSICDKIAGFVLRDTGKFEMDLQGIVWETKLAEACLLNHSVRTTTPRKTPVGRSFLDKLADNWFNDKDQLDAETLADIKAGKPVSQIDLVTLLWRNACALAFRMDGEAVNDKRQEYYKVTREMLFAQADSAEWVASDDGHVFTEEEKHASVVNALVRSALRLTGKGEVQKDKEGSFAMFVLRVFAKDILANLQANSEAARAAEAEYADFDLDSIHAEDLRIDDLDD